jgi:membrane protease YdiL (CAAX protease family)
VTPRGFWARVVVGSALAVVLLVAVAPQRPQRRLSPPLAVAAGVLAGAALYGVAVRRPPTAGVRSASLAVAAGRHAFFALLATNEEIVWRRVALGVLLPRGLLPALVVSSAVFALAHRHRRVLQLATGSVFGGVYLATGFLPASIGAHWTYNELVARVRNELPA